MQKSKRESNLDILRMLCCIAVVIVHVSSRYKAGITDPSLFGERINTNIPTILLFDTMTRFAVPCFVMLAGAFALGNEKNGDYRSYYRRVFRSIGIPMILFSGLYVGNAMISQLKLILADQAGWGALLQPVKAWILGAPYYHMWYLYAMIGLYILTPLLVRWKNSISKKTFRGCALVLLVLCTISGWTSQQKFQWDLGGTFCYIGYYITGYVLRDALSQRKDGRESWLLILSGLAVELLVTWIQYQHTMRGLAESDEVYSVIGTFNPLIVLSSVLLYAGFCLMKADVNVDWFVNRSFLIYLFHAGVLTQMFGWIIRVDIAYCGLSIAAGAAAVLVISFALAVAYEKLWAKLEKRWDISQRLTDLILPEK